LGKPILTIAIATLGTATALRDAHRAASLTT